jgi:hypothetical protein
VNDKKMADLYDALLDELLDRIKSGEARPADLAVARQFLKDNNVEALPAARPGLVDLKSLLPSGTAFAGPEDPVQ